MAGRAEKLKLCFDSLDKDNSGFISLTEVKAYVQGTGVELDKISANAQALMDKLDKNRDGQISFAEFSETMSSLTGSMTDDQFEAFFKGVVDACKGIKQADIALLKVMA